MKQEAFAELVDSLKEAVAIRKGEIKASRTSSVEAPNVMSIRKGYKMTQPEFALLLGISVGTLRNWEQGRRTPHGPAKVLLQVAASHPEALLDSKGIGH
jgi:putative transcriptional regulator